MEIVVSTVGGVIVEEEAWNASASFEFIDNSYSDSFWDYSGRFMLLFSISDVYDESQDNIVLTGKMWEEVSTDFGLYTFQNLSVYHYYETSYEHRKYHTNIV